MKIFLLADPTSPHTIKWARALSERGCQILLAGFLDPERSVFSGFPNIQVVHLKADESLVRQSTPSLSKIFYLRALPRIKRLIKQFQPDILHAHYASSYGLLGALSGFQPFAISIWGSDIYSFPRRSFFHKFLIRFNLRRSYRIFSTSYDMAREARYYTDKDIEVIPFGIDTDFFKPGPGRRFFANGTLVIGAVKTLERHYGIDTLIRAFASVCHRIPGQPLGLLLVGGGSLKKELQMLALDLKIVDKVRFTGRIPYDQVPQYHNSLDIAVVVSHRESFGVSAIESSSCGKPVIASSVDGLPEAVKHQITGLLVPVNDVSSTAEALYCLARDTELRHKLGEQGRQFVRQQFNWQQNVEQMLAAYRSLLSGHTEKI